MFKRMFLQRVLFLLLGLALLLAPLGSAQPAAAKTAVYRYANGLQLQAGLDIPVYRIQTVKVTSDLTQSIITQAFSGIYDRTNLSIGMDTYNGFERFTGFNPDRQTLLEQYGATGGFYAYDPDLAFGQEVQEDAELDPLQAQRSTCQFLLQHQQTLLEGREDILIPGLDKLCDVSYTINAPYRVFTETLSTQENVPDAETTHTPLRLMATVPIQVNTGLHSQIPSLPLAGPGGHISLIFSDTNPDSKAPSLDGTVPGLQAFAMPVFGRTFEWIRNVPPADPDAAKNQVMQMVKDSYPDGTDIFVPDPALAFFLSDAAAPQTLLEPMLFFDGVSVVVDGQTVIFRQITLPGAASGEGGLGPTVDILSPTGGSLVLAGTPVSLQGTVQDGVPPYNYSWQLDDGTVLASGAAANPGDLPAASAALPLLNSKGAPSTQAIHLVVTDSEGATRVASVSVGTPVPVYLPLMSKETGEASTARASLLAEIQAPEAINYRFGVEYGSDYPPYGPGGSDLGGVPPDANGFSSGMMGLGWPRVFNWYNANAWEKDWRDCSLGGIDCSWGVDRADFVYYAGHGSAGGISLPSNSHDSSWFDGSNARYQNARWVGFASCQTLRVQGFAAGSEPIRRWFNAFRGAHLIMGFNSNMADIAYGPRFVDNMRIPTFPFIGELPWAQRTIAEAWVQTAFQMNAGKPAYLWATSPSVNPIGNKLPKVGDPLLPRPTPVNWYYWVWWNE